MNYTEQVPLILGCISAFSVAICVVAASMVTLLGLCKHFVYRLALYQVIGALLANVATGLVLVQFFKPNDSKSCHVIAFINVYFGWIKLLLTLGLTAHVFSHVMCRKSLAYLEWFYLATCLVLPLFFSWVPFVTGNYGEANFACFIDTAGDRSTHVDGIIELFSLYYGPFLVLMTLDMAFVLVTAVCVKRRSLAHRTSVMSSSLNNPYDDQRRGLAYFAPLLAYPTFLFVIVSLPCVVSVLKVYKITNQWLVLTAGVMVSSIGWVAGSVLIVHVCYAHVCMKITSIPFETDAQTPLVEDSEREPT